MGLWLPFLHELEYLYHESQQKQERGISRENQERRTIFSDFSTLHRCLSLNIYSKKVNKSMKESVQRDACLFSTSLNITRKSTKAGQRHFKKNGSGLDVYVPFHGAGPAPTGGRRPSCLSAAGPMSRTCACPGTCTTKGVSS